MDAPYELMECGGDPLDPDEWLALYPCLLYTSRCV